jgi:hypothetical protein
MQLHGYYLVHIVKPFWLWAFCITCRQTTQYFCEPTIPISANKNIERRFVFIDGLPPASLFAVLGEVAAASLFLSADYKAYDNSTYRSKAKYRSECTGYDCIWYAHQEANEETIDPPCKGKRRIGN